MNAVRAATDWRNKAQPKNATWKRFTTCCNLEAHGSFLLANQQLGKKLSGPCHLDLTAFGSTGLVHFLYRQNYNMTQ